MTYWSAINCHVEKEKYLTERSPKVVSGGVGDEEAAPAEAGIGAPAAQEKTGGEKRKGCVII